MKTINCQSYQVWIGEEWDQLSGFLTQNDYSKILLLVDDMTNKHCLPFLQANLNKFEFGVIEIPHGEVNKNIDTCIHIWKSMIRENADRKSLLINLGGGVIGDIGGFCASTYMRGIDFIHIPTTLLSQVDSSVGAKLGIDFIQNKNLIGVFREPRLVYINTQFLKTLSHRQILSGFAEVIKHALIKDQFMWKDLLSIQVFENLDWQELIQKNINIKKQVVESDAFESGLRKILNFGHTIGHAVETCYLTETQSLLHGEAIAIGMICECHIALQLEMISMPIMHAIRNYIAELFTLPKGIYSQKEKLIHHIYLDKKNKKQKLMFSLIDRIGHCKFDVPVNEELVVQSLIYYDRFYNN